MQRSASCSCRGNVRRESAASALPPSWSRLRAEALSRRRQPAVLLVAAAAAAADPADPAPAAPEDPPHPLVSFVLSEGGVVDGVRPVAGTSQGWGLAADRDLPRGHRCVVLPPGCHLTLERTLAAAPPDARAALDALSADIPPELWGARLALALLRERALGRESRYAAYVAALPGQFPGVPIFWPAAAVDALDYPPVAEQVKKRCRWLHEFAARHFSSGASTVSSAGGEAASGGGKEGEEASPAAAAARAALAGASADVSALGWGLAAVTSRAFRVGGASKPAVMLPLVDLCNHDFDPNAEVVPFDEDGAVVARRRMRRRQEQQQGRQQQQQEEQEGRAGAAATRGAGGGGGGIAVVTRRPVKRGEPVLLSYGPLPNDFLLLDYGFVADDNPHDAVSLRFDASGLLTAGASAAGVLREHAGLAPTAGGGGGASSSSSSSSSPNRPPPELLDFGEELERSAYKRRRLASLGLIPSGATAAPAASLEVAIGAGSPGGAPVADARLLAAARLLASRQASETEGLPDRELGAWARDAGAPGAAPLGNRANETAALRTLAGVAAVALSSFRSSLEEDEAALSRLLLEQQRRSSPSASSPSPSSSPWEGLGASARRDVALAVRLRAGKKRVLLRAVEALGRRVEALRQRRDVAALPAAARRGGGGGGGGGAGGEPATGRGFGAAKRR